MGIEQVAAWLEYYYLQLGESIKKTQSHFEEINPRIFI